MTFQAAKDAELATGYRLVERLGAGGYGEVWKATAPGGFAKAIKIVYGAMDGPQAEQELRALSRIKEVRHPFLLSLERVDVIDGQLVIVTELAEGSLADRYARCRQEGLPGIPRAELLAHLRDAADALDYMAQTHGLQHLDVKPQNLLLVGNRMKVADFGLVRRLGTTRVSVAGVTPVYATPEAFDNRISKFSDQYSLAIVYQEMLTGVRPFPGSTLMQLAAQHISCPPLLTPLPAGDRPVIARALAKVPEERFPACLAMVDALFAAVKGAGVSTVILPRVPSNPSQPAVPPVGAPEVPAGLGTVATLFDISNEPTPSQASTADVVASESDLPSEDVLRQTVIPGTGGVPGSGRREWFRPLADLKQGLRPTLFIGVGGLAAATLCRLKRRLRERHGDLARVPVFRLLLLDTDREAVRRALQDPAGALDPEETLLTPLHPPEHYRPEAKRLLHWLDRRWLYGIPRSLRTEGLRPLGRLAFVDNASEIVARAREALAGIAAAAAEARKSLRDDTPRVFLVASVAGGTGGGMVLGLAYALRQVLGELGLSADGLCAVLLSATGPKLEDQEMARVNASATLAELDQFSRPASAYPGDPASGLTASPAGQRPFEESYLIELGQQINREAAEAATDAVADYLCLDASADGGAFFDRFRKRSRPGPGEPFSVRTFGLARVNARGERPLGLVARLLCRRLIDNWLAEPGVDELKELQREAQRQATSLGLEERSLALLLQTSVNAAMGDGSDDFIPRVLADAAAAAGSTQPHRMLWHVDASFAVPDAGAQGAGVPLNTAVRQTVERYGADIGRGVADWLAGLTGRPGKRFRAAERSARAVARALAELIKSASARAERAKARRQAMRRQIEAAATRPSHRNGRTAPPSARGTGLRTGREMQEYCRLWLRETAEANAVILLAAVERQVDDFLEETALCCRHLKALADRFRPASVHGHTHETQQSGRSASVRISGDAARSGAAHDELLPPGLVAHFDRSLQDAYGEKAGGMWGVFSRGGDPFRREVAADRPTTDRFAEDLFARARAAVQGSIKDLTTAQLFLQTHGGPEKALPVLLAHAEAARPRLPVNEGSQHLVVALPEGPSGDMLNEMLATALRGTPGSLVRTDEEVILCYETAGCPLAAMARALIGPREVPEELVRQVMTRPPLPLALNGRAEAAAGG